MTTRNIMAIVASLGLAACAATGPSYTAAVSKPRQDSERSARLVLYRGDSVVSPFGMARVQIDNIEVGGVADAGFNYYDVTPGDHRIVVDHEGRPGECRIKASVKAGDTAYFKIEQRGASTASMFIAGAGLIGVAAALALEGSGEPCAGTWEIRPVGTEALEELKNLKETQGNG